MTRKDFKAIAAILAGDYATATPAEKGKVVRISLSLADYFQKANPRFRRDLFYAAIWGEDNPYNA
jgi:hypothetical protein